MKYGRGSCKCSVIFPSANQDAPFKTLKHRSHWMIESIGKWWFTTWSYKLYIHCRSIHYIPHIHPEGLDSPGRLGKCSPPWRWWILCATCFRIAPVRWPQMACRNDPSHGLVDLGSYNPVIFQLWLVVQLHSMKWWLVTNGIPNDSKLIDDDNPW